ncbi:hypothetical protein SAMN04487904_103245 [Actinopolyspora lacussalsi subsp. righensis]|uniref:Uncharacterized protein n=1 Tax=Actinopolyspora righensis TaxID=995060 RepID=A0A1I6YUJ1_9ACTN|nr:hypothetical protein SAMN04487904_103245 [Actinopolyspora righensis]
MAAEVPSGITERERAGYRNPRAHYAAVPGKTQAEWRSTAEFDGYMSETRQRTWCRATVRESTDDNPDRLPGGKTARARDHPSTGSPIAASTARARNSPLR